MPTANYGINSVFNMGPNIWCLFQGRNKIYFFNFHFQNQKIRKWILKKCPCKLCQTYRKFGFYLDLFQQFARFCRCISTGKLNRYGNLIEWWIKFSFISVKLHSIMHIKTILYYIMQIYICVFLLLKPLNCIYKFRKNSILAIFSRDLHLAFSL